MSVRFIEEIEILRRRLRRAAILRALGWSLFLVTLAGTALGAADYLFRFREGGMRLLLTGAWLAVAIECLRRWVVPALALSIQPIALAIWAERVFPAFRGKLAAAVEFAGLVSGDPEARANLAEESPALRRAALREAESLMQSGAPPWPLPRREVWSALGLGAAAILLLCTLVWANPVAAGTATLRLLNPFLDLPWPQRTHLEVVSFPDRIARGSTFEVVVEEASGRLPEDVTIEYHWIDQQSLPAESYAMERLGTTARHRRENVLSSFAFRVRGGDDVNGEWHRVDVVEAPRITDWTLRLIPPEYTGWPSENSDGAVKALVGTQVFPRGRADRSLRAVKIEVSTGERFDLVIGRDGESFALPPEKRDGVSPEVAVSETVHRTETATQAESSPWVVRHSGSYRLFVEAADGTANPDPPRWEIRAIVDEPPTAWVETDGRIRYSTPEAKVPLIFSARDDLAIRSVRFVCTDSSTRRVFPEKTVYQGALPFPTREEKMSQGEKWGESRSLRAELNLAEMEAVAGMTLEVRAVAEDYAGQTAESASVSLRVVDTGQLLDLAAADRNRILTQLSQLLEVQREALADVRSWQDRAASSAPLARLDAESLAAVELAQRQIGQALGDPAVGLPSDIARIVSELVIGGLDTHPDVRRLEELAESLSKLDQEHARPAEQGLTQAVKSLRSLLSENAATNPGGIRLDEGSRERVAGILQQVRGHQEVVERELQAILESWGVLRRQFELRRRLENILQRQETLAENVLRLGQQTVGRSRDALLPQELEDLRNAAQEQSALAEEFDRLMEDTADAANAADARAGLQDKRKSDSAGTDPAASLGSRSGEQDSAEPGSQRLREVVDRARDAAIGARMRTAATAVDDNRLSQGLQTQREVIADLRGLLDRLAEGGASQSDADVWRNAANKLQELIGRQSRWRSKIEQRSQSGDERADLWRDLAAQQSADSESAGTLAQELLSANASSAAEASANAAAAMNRAAEAARGADAEAAGQAAQNAEDDLRRALADVNQRLAREAARQAASELRRSLEILRGLTERQKELTQETKELAAGKAVESNPYERQRGLAGEIGELRGRWVDRPIAGFILGEAEAAMESAAQRLERRLYDEATLTLQSQAAAALEKVTESLADRATAQTPSQASGQGGADGQSGRPVDPDLARQAQLLLAELKLARELQSDILRRTEELDAKRQTESGGEAAAELARLSERQSQLRGMLETLLEGPTTSQPATPSPRLPSPDPPALIPPSSPGSLEDLFKP
ncbi:coiled-coil domain-containing protein [Thermopirellula anaerolimosa]